MASQTNELDSLDPSSLRPVTDILAQSSVASIVNKTTRSKSFLAPPFFFLTSLLSQLICMLIYRDAYSDPFLAPLHNISRVSVEK